MQDCNILWCGKYYQSWTIDPHSHNYFQMVGMLGGEGEVRVEGISYKIENEQIYLFTPKTEHDIVQAEGSPHILKMFDIKFMLAPSPLYGQLMKLEPMFTVKNFSALLRIFDFILDESAVQNPFYCELSSAYLIEMLVRILREKSGIIKTKENMIRVRPVDSYKGVDLASLTQYIDNHYAHMISLEDLSTLTNMNKTTLISVFKDIYGTTPIRYINKLRLEKAKELLTNNDLAIGEISDLVGFQSIHYFSRFFKDKEGCTPKEFRKRIKQSNFHLFSPDPADSQ